MLYFNPKMPLSHLFAPVPHLAFLLCVGVLHHQGTTSPGHCLTPMESCYSHLSVQGIPKFNKSASFRISVSSSEHRNLKRQIGE